MPYKCMKIELYFGERVSGTSAVTAVIYAGTAQSLNGSTRELLAYATFTMGDM